MLTTNIIVPSRRDVAIKAQGGAKASVASLGATLGCEAIPFRSFSFKPSPNGTALIPGVSFVEVPTVFAAPFRAATSVAAVGLLRVPRAASTLAALTLPCPALR